MGNRDPVSATWTFRRQLRQLWMTCQGCSWWSGGAWVLWHWRVPQVTPERTWSPGGLWSLAGWCWASGEVRGFKCPHVLEMAGPGDGWSSQQVLSWPRGSGFPVALLSLPGSANNDGEGWKVNLTPSAFLRQDPAAACTVLSAFCLVILS